MTDSLRDAIKFIPPSGEEEKQEMLDFVNQHFVPLEPLNKACNICEPGYRMAWFDKFVGDYISEGYSLMAVDADSGQLVGVAIFTKCSKENVDEGSPATRAGEEEGEEKDKAQKVGNRWEVCPRKFAGILDFLGRICDEAGDLFQRFGVEEYLEMFILCTHSDRLHPGLGTLLAEEAFERAQKEWDFDVVVTEATSFHSQKIFAKLGFEVLHEVDFEDYLDPESGEIVFPKYGPHKSVQLMAKRL